MLHIIYLVDATIYNNLVMGNIWEGVSLEIAKQRKTFTQKQKIALMGKIFYNQELSITLLTHVLLKDIISIAI